MKFSLRIFKNLYYPIHEAVETGNLEIVKILEFNIEKIRSLHAILYFYSHI